MKSESKKYSIGLHFWVQEEKGHFLGRGRVQLLENIKKTGSITKAARAMEMSYRQAWQMIEDMNARATKPLVQKILGGKGGGGAVITEAGENAIHLFNKLERKVMKYADELSNKLKL